MILTNQKIYSVQISLLKLCALYTTTRTSMFTRSFQNVQQTDHRDLNTSR